MEIKLYLTRKTQRRYLYLCLQKKNNSKFWEKMIEWIVWILKIYLRSLVFDITFLCIFRSDAKHYLW